MGETYIKNEGGKEAVYERGLFYDNRIGELHQNFDGSKETRNIFGQNVRVDVPGLFSTDRQANIDGQKGVFSQGFFESQPTFKPEPSGGGRGSRRSSISHESSSHTGGSRGGGSYSSTGSGTSGLLSALVIGGILCFGIFNSATRPNVSGINRARPAADYSAQQRTRSLSLEENVLKLSAYLRQNNQLAGDFDDYQLVIPPAAKRDAYKINPKAQTYDIAYISPYSLYTFHTPDGGATWTPVPSIDIYIAELRNYYGYHHKEFETRGISIKDFMKEFEKCRISPRPPNALEEVSLNECDWDTSGLEPWGDDKAKLNWWLEEELQKEPRLKRTVEYLAETIYMQANGFATTIHGCSQRGDALWAAGRYEGYLAGKKGPEGWASRGFICYSPDNGRNWTRQWFSADNGPDPVYGIYFSDADEGWAFTQKRILHTSDKGFTWDKIFESDGTGGPISNLYILGGNKLIIAEDHPPLYLYSSDDRGLSWSKLSMTDNHRKGLEELKGSLGGKLVHYGGIYQVEERAHLLADNIG